MIARINVFCNVNRIEKWGRLFSNTIDKDPLLLITIDGKIVIKVFINTLGFHFCPILTKLQFFFRSF